MTKSTPMLLQAAFSLESVAHLRGLERELLPQAQFLRDLHAQIFRLNQPEDGTGAEERIMELMNWIEVNS